MEFGLYEWVYILTAIFGTYILLRFMAVFFDSRRTSIKVEALSYIAYFFIVNGIYLFINIPIITMSANLAAFFLLSLNYEATIKKRILSTFLIYIILVTVEMTVALLNGCLNFSMFKVNDFSSVFGVIVCNILSYFVVLILNNFKNIKKGKSIPGSYWLCILIIPFGSLYTIIMLFNAQGLTVNQILAALILIFIINIVSFHLYDVISTFFAGKDAEFIGNKYSGGKKTAGELQVKYEKGVVK